jgi:SAM-dependent methyltransferase
MARAGLFNRSFYRRFKDKLWVTLGVKLVKERNTFLVHLLYELEKELKISNSVDASECCLLDIGCGNGNLTAQISEIYNLKTIGIDLNKSFLPRSSVAFLVASGSSLPFKPKSCALVIAISMIEHMPEVRRQEFYDEVKKVLIDDGTFIMQLPNRYFPIEHHSFLPFVGYLPSRWHSAFFYDYLSVPSKNKTVSELVKGEFKIVKIVGYGVPFYSVLERSALSKVFPFGFLIVAKKI